MLTLILVVLVMVILMMLGIIIHLVNKLYATSIHLKDLVPLDLLIALRDGGVALAKQVTEATPTERDDWIPGAIEKVSEILIKTPESTAQASG